MQISGSVRRQRTDGGSMPQKRRMGHAASGEDGSSLLDCTQTQNKNILLKRRTINLLYVIVYRLKKAIAPSGLTKNLLAIGR